MSAGAWSISARLAAANLEDATGLASLRALVTEARRLHPSVTAGAARPELGTSRVSPAVVVGLADAAVKPEVVSLASLDVQAQASARENYGMGTAGEGS